MGLREEKKKKTRKSISDMATRLFVERGYDQVTTAEIAERAEVSVPTLFNYFPTKEALVFDDDQEVEAELLASVVHRRKGQSILDALLETGIAQLEAIPSSQKKDYDVFMSLIENTPALSVYSRQMWMRYEKSLAAVIRKEAKKKLSATEASSLARFVLDSYHRAAGASQPKAALTAMFALMRDGWKG